MNKEYRPRFRFLVFDVDCTLVDTSRLGIEATNVALKSIGFPPVSQAEYNRGTAFQTCERMTQHTHGSSGKTGEELAALYNVAELRTISSMLCPRYDGMRELLITLRAAGCCMCALSNGVTENTREKLRVNGLLDSFTETLGYDCVPRPKPDPSGVLVLCERMHCTPNECVVVGDSVSDLKAAHLSGAACFIGVLWGQHSESELRAAAKSLHFENVMFVKTVIELNNFLFCL